MNLQTILEGMRRRQSGMRSPEIITLEIGEINQETGELRITLRSGNEAFDVDILGDEAIVIQECTEYHPEIMGPA